MTPVLYAVEGVTDAPVAEKLIRAVGLTPRQVFAGGGSSAVDDRLVRWAQPSNHQRMLVLRDWDARDGAACAPELRARVAGSTCPANVVVRIVVRSVEAWLMADRDVAGRFFRTSSIPIDPEALASAKLGLVAACRDSTNRTIRQAMVPRSRSRAAVGPEYTLRVLEFARDHWDPERARATAPSLDRALRRMDELVHRGAW